MNPTPYRHAADRIVSRIAVPVLREPVFFCFMLLTFVWPQLTSDLFRIEATHWEILGLYIAYAYAATLPLGIPGGDQGGEEQLLHPLLFLPRTGA